MKRYQIKYLKIVLIALLLLILGMVSTGQLKKLCHLTDRTLTVGVFSDSYWDVQNGYAYQIINDAIEKFEAQNSAVKVQYVSGIMKNDYAEWLSQKLLEDEAPDVFFVPDSDFGDLAQIGALKKLDQCMDADPDFAAEDFYAPALESGQYMGTQYALPYECAPRLMFVNKTLLEKEGVHMPKEGYTWDDFYQMCRAVTKDTDGNGTIDQFGVTGYTWQDAFDENGVTLFLDNGTKCNLNDDRVAQSIHYLEQLGSLSSGYEVSAKDFDHGDVAFMPMSFSEYRAYKAYPLSIKKYAGFEWECAQMPAGPEGDNVSSLDTLLVGMNARTANERLAWQFMKLLSCDTQIQAEIFDYSEGVSVLPAVTESEKTRQLLQKDGGDNVVMNTEVLRTVLTQAVSQPRFGNYDEAMEQVDRAVESVMDSSQNVSMNLIVKNREINKYLKNIRYQKK